MPKSPKSTAIATGPIRDRLMGLLPWLTSYRRTEIRQTSRNAWSCYHASLHAKAADLFGIVIRAQPNSVSAYRGRAMCLIALGRHAEALDDLDTWALLAPTSDEALYLRAQCHLALGNERNRADDLERVVQLNPLHANALKALGRSYVPYAARAPS